MEGGTEACSKHWLQPEKKELTGLSVYWSSDWPHSEAALRPLHQLHNASRPTSFHQPISRTAKTIQQSTKLCADYLWCNAKTFHEQQTDEGKGVVS